MTGSSFAVAVAPRPAGLVLTGPMALAFLILAAGASVRLTGLDHAGFSFCYFKVLTGHACLTCGTTRAFGYLARFDLASAFAIQPLATASALLVIAWGFVDAALLPASRRTTVKLEGRALRVFAASAAILIALNWFYLLATGV
jgi:hypothetical protein